MTKHRLYRPIILMTLAVTVSSCDSIVSAMVDNDMNRSLNGVTKKEQQAERKAEVEKKLKDY